MLCQIAFLFRLHHQHYIQSLLHLLFMTIVPVKTFRKLRLLLQPFPGIIHQMWPFTLYVGTTGTQDNLYKCLFWGTNFSPFCFSFNRKKPWEGLMSATTGRQTRRDRERQCSSRSRPTIKNFFNTCLISYHKQLSILSWTPRILIRVPWVLVSKQISVYW